MIRHIKAAITRFDKAAQAYAFIGSAHPEDRTAIEHQYETAKSSLISIIERNLK